MGMRNDAITVLKKAEEALIDSISYELTEARSDELVEALIGEGYSNIDTLLEKGERLHKIKLMIAEIPPEPVVVTSKIKPSEKPLMHIGEQLTASVIVGSLAIQPQENFRMFVDRVRLEQIDDAAELLAQISGMTFPQAQHATLHFNEKFGDDPDCEAQLMSLRAQLHTSLNGSLVLLHTLFGISGPRAIDAYNNLRTMV